MIKEYEDAIAIYFATILGSSVKVVFSDEEEMLASYTKAISYPSVIFYREPVDWTNIRSISVSDYTTKDTLKYFEQSYIARVYLEKQSEALTLASKLSFAIEDKPFVTISYLNENLKVAIRVLYIKVGSTKTTFDKKGPSRFVELRWFSQLFIDKVYTDTYYKSFEIIVKDDKNYIIKTIKSDSNE